MAEKTSSTLPLSRVKTIMKSSPEVSSISQEALHLTGKATELFIQALAKFSYQQSDDKSSLQYKDLAHIVNSEETLQFLHGHVIKHRWNLKTKSHSLGVDEKKSSGPVYPFKPRVSLDSSIKSPKIRAQDYRARIKQDPVLYREFRQYENNRHREYRALLTEEKKKRVRELQKIRQRNYRKRLMERRQALPTNSKSVTRESINAQTGTRKRKNYSPQRRTAVNKKRNGVVLEGSQSSLQRARQQQNRKCRKGQVQMALTNSKSGRRESVKAEMEKRKKNKIAAKRMRDNFTPEKREEVNKKRMERYYQKKAGLHS